MAFQHDELPAIQQIKVRANRRILFAGVILLPSAIGLCGLTAGLEAVHGSGFSRNTKLAKLLLLLGRLFACEKSKSPC